MCIRDRVRSSVEAISDATQASFDIVIEVPALGSVGGPTGDRHGADTGFDGMHGDISHDWVDALATSHTSFEPVPSPADVAQAIIGPTTADDVIESTVPVSYTPPRHEGLEPAHVYPFPGMAGYTEDAPNTADGSPRAVPAPAATGTVPAIAVVGVPVEPSGEPPYFFSMAGETIDLATRKGLAVGQQAVATTIGAAGDVVQTIVEQRRVQRRIHDLMARANAGPLGIDDVIQLGHDLEQARAEFAAVHVDRRAISELVASLEQDRAFLGRLIDLLWRA